MTTELTAFGQQTYDSDKRLHIIRISPRINSCPDVSAEKYHYLSTVLHELHHCQQKEAEGNTFWSKKFRLAPDIKTEAYAEYFSPCEIAAREYEAAYTLKAVELYNKHLKKNK